MMYFYFLSNKHSFPPTIIICETLMKKPVKIELLWLKLGWEGNADSPAPPRHLCIMLENKWSCGPPTTTEQSQALEVPTIELYTPSEQQLGAQGTPSCLGYQGIMDVAVMRKKSPE